MKYALLIYENEQAWGDEKKGPMLDEVVDQHTALIKELGPRHIGGAGLKNTATATTLKSSGSGQTLHDGPFAETKEQLGGFYLVDVPDLDAAIDIARKMPMVGQGSIEIRPLLG